MPLLASVLPAADFPRIVVLAAAGLLAANALTNLPSYLALEPFAREAPQVWALLAGG